MSNLATCHHETLAKEGAAHVQRCVECGCISIHLGPFTLRVDEQGMEALGLVLTRAAAELHVTKVKEALRTTQRGAA